MALDSAVYLVTREIAERSGLITSRYRVADGRYVLDNKDLSRVRFTTDEYISGLEGVEKVDPSVADTLIAENGFKMGYDGLEDNTQAVNETETENENNENVETIVANDVGNVEDILGGGTQQENNEQEQEEETKTNEEEE